MKFIALALALLSSSCITTAVAYTQFEGRGDVRVGLSTEHDPQVVAVGECSGEAGVFVKGSGFPMTMPFSVSHGTVFLYDGETGTTLPLDADLPEWALAMFREGELMELVERFGAP